jgi:hypothetical protein
MKSYEKYNRMIAREQKRYEGLVGVCSFEDLRDTEIRQADQQYMSVQLMNTQGKDN